MTEQSPRFALPLLQAGQAQKEVAHNEAIVALEFLAQAIAETAGDAAPPATPTEGQSWIVGTAPAGAWTGNAGALASWTAGGWRFVAPVEGMAVYVKATQAVTRRWDGAWSVGPIAASRLVVGGDQVVGARQAAIGTPRVARRSMPRRVPRSPRSSAHYGRTALLRLKSDTVPNFCDTVKPASEVGVKAAVRWIGSMGFCRYRHISAAVHLSVRLRIG